MSAAAPPARRPFWALLWQATVYELRKQVAFRVGFLVREYS